MEIACWAGLCAGLEVKGLMNCWLAFAEWLVGRIHNLKMLNPQPREKAIPLSTAPCEVVMMVVKG